MDGPGPWTGWRRALLAAGAALALAGLLGALWLVNRPGGGSPAVRGSVSTVAGDADGAPAPAPTAPQETEIEWLFQLSTDPSFATLACPATWSTGLPDRASVSACVQPGRTYHCRLAAREGFEVSSWSGVRELTVRGGWYGEFQTRLSWLLNEVVNAIPQPVPAEPGDSEPVWCDEDGSPPTIPIDHASTETGWIEICAIRPDPPTVPEVPTPGPTDDVEAPCRAARAGPAADVPGDGSRPAIARELPLNVWDGFVTFSDPRAEGEDYESGLLALDDAFASPLHVAERGCAVTALRPGQISDRPMLLEVWPSEPPDDRRDWQHEVDVDLILPSGTICFATSEGQAGDCTSVPPGRYRARLSARNLESPREDTFDGKDRWRLRLWPSAADAPPALRTAWAGWDG